MNTKIFAHVTTGSRNGWGLTAPHLRGALSFMADAFPEMSLSAYRIWRHQGYDWQGNVNLDIMPGFDNLEMEDMAAQAAYWWPIINAQATAEEERLGVEFDAIKITNEVGGGGDLPDTDYALQKLVAYERAVLPLAEADGRKILVCNCATDSPQWDDWQSIIAPFVIEAAERGHIYGRHAYADKIGGLDYLVKDGLPMTGAARPFKEMDHFRSLGYRIPTVLGELGFYAFPGTSHFINQVGAYDGLMQNYDELGGGALFTYGEWLGANIEAASAALADYLAARPYEVWLPEFIGPATPPPTKHKAIVVKLPQEMTFMEWQDAASIAYGMRHTVTASTDDMLTILHGGNDESFVKASHPERDASALALVESAGYRWEPLYNEPEPTIPIIADITDQLPKHATLKYATRPLAGITTLTVHHTVSPPDRSIESLAIYHVSSNGWPGIGYHFVIKDDGRIFQTNALTTKSYHAGSYAAPGDENAISIGIALQGDFTNAPPPQAQQDAAKWLVQKLSGDLPGITAVLGHRQMPGAQTQCPGNTWAKWLPYVAGEVKPETPAEPPPPPPPTGQTYDMLDYLRGPDKLQYDTDAKLFTQTFQYRHDGNLWRLVKGGNGQHECYYYDENFIYRREDTSQGDDKFYLHLTDGVPGAPWVKRFMKVGETAVFTKQVQHYWNDCTKRLPLATVTDSIKMVSHHAAYTFPHTGKTLQDVIELLWVEGGETYWFAKGWGLVGFTDQGIIAEFMSGPLQGRPDLPIKPPGCVELSPRYFV